MSNSSSPYPGANPDPQGQQPAPSHLDPNVQHQAWPPPQSPQGQEAPPQVSYPPGAPPQGAYPPQGVQPQTPPQGVYPPQQPYPQQGGAYPPGANPPQQPYPQQPYPQQPYPPGTQSGYAPAPKKKGSNALLWGLGGCFMLFMLLVVAITGLYYIGKNAQNSSTNPIVVHSGTTSGNDDSVSSEPSSGGTQSFTNSSDGLNDTLKANYADFSFDYPSNWTLDRQGTKADGQNFVKVTHDVDAFTYENFAVGYFSGSLSLAPKIMAQLEPSFAQGFPGYTKVSEGGATFNDRYNGYELSFTAHKAARTAKAAFSPFRLVQSSSDDSSSSDSNPPAPPSPPSNSSSTDSSSSDSNSSGSNSSDSNSGAFDIYGKIFLLPATGTSKRGVCIIMLGTSKSPDVKSLDDLGTKGDLPTIIDSFEMGK